MTSGEVLFILAFIVLPTAVLVSSIWAVIFVRRRPDRIAPHWAQPAPMEGDETELSDQDTVLIATVQRPQHIDKAERAVSDNGDPTETEYLVAASKRYEAVEAEHTKQQDEELAAAGLVRDDSDVLIGPDVPPFGSSVKWSPTPDLLESEEAQTTDDLNDIVEQVSTIESDEPEAEPEASIDEAGAPIEDDTPYDDGPETISQTSELPVIEPEPPPAEAREHSPPAETQPESGKSWRRRRSAKLRPPESDAPRSRGRNRDAQRQVPQLGRSSRRSSEPAQNPPVEPDPDHDETRADTR